MTEPISSSEPAPATRLHPALRFLRDRWLAIVLLVLAIAFIAQNYNVVQLNLLWISLSSPLWLFLLGVFLLGMLISYLVRRKS